MNEVKIRVDEPKAYVEYKLRSLRDLFKDSPFSVEVEETEHESVSGQIYKLHHLVIRKEGSYANDAKTKADM